MTKQTEAQRLAELLDHGHPLESEAKQAAALLRRQEELLEQALEALTIVRIHPDSTPLEYNICANALATIHAHREAK